MKFSRSEASLFVPDGTPIPGALRRVTHLGIGAHADDLEIIGYHGILKSRNSPTDWFGGVTCTDGSRAPRRGPYRKITDAELRDLRRREQNEAARIGRYGVVIQLDHQSGTLRGRNPGLESDLEQIIGEMSPRGVIYTHNLADKHPTHVAVALAVIESARRLPDERRPETIYGCEVWRSLDWMLDQDKVQLDVGGDPNLAGALLKAFDSQISGGKSYDLAVTGRRRANAVFLDFDRSQEVAELDFAMDLTPLIRDAGLDPAEYVRHFLERFGEDVAVNIEKLRRKRPREGGRNRSRRDERES